MSVGGVSRRSSFWKGFVRICKKILRGREYNYSETVLWYLYGRFLPKTKGLKIVEIGSAPGWNLLNFKERLGYVPFGIEYSHVGAEQNRKNSPPQESRQRMSQRQIFSRQIYIDNTKNILML